MTAPIEIDPAIVEVAARAAYPETFKLPRLNLYADLYAKAYEQTRATLEAAAPLLVAGEIEKLREPTEEMLDAARDWSKAKYGMPIGNDAAQGCWQAMIAAIRQRGKQT